MKRLFATLYAPMFLAGFLGSGIALVGGTGLSAWWLLVFFLCALLVSFLAEHLLPYEPCWNLDQGDSGRDVAHALVNEACNAAALLMLPGLVAVLCEPLQALNTPESGGLLLLLTLAAALLGIALQLALRLWTYRMCVLSQLTGKH